MPPPTTLGYGLVGEARPTLRTKGRLGRTTVGIPMKVRVRKYHGQSTEIATLGCSGPRAARFLAHDRRGEAPYSGAQAHGRRGTPSGHRRLSGRDYTWTNRGSHPSSVQ